MESPGQVPGVRYIYNYIYNLYNYKQDKRHGQQYKQSKLWCNEAKNKQHDNKTDTLCKLKPLLMSINV